MQPIKTKYDPTPIPIRRFDWSATFGDPDLGCLVGWGATEKAAIQDLKEQLQMDCELGNEMVLPERAGRYHR